jgi:DNA-binding MarR family transcriptional regulator
VPDAVGRSQFDYHRTRMDSIVRRLAAPQFEPELEIVVSEAAEAIVGLALIGATDVRCDTYDIGCVWFDRIRESMTSDLQAMLEPFQTWHASHALWHGLIALVAEGPTSLADLLAHVEAMTPDDFWLQAVGFHERHEPSAELREAMLAAGRGELEPLERMLAGDPHVTGRWLQGLPRALGGSADSAQARVLALLSLWREDVFAREWAEIAPTVERDVDEKRRLARVAPVSAVVEEATNGGEYAPEVGIGRVLLIPTYLGRPWVIHGRQRSTLVMVTPAGEAALAGSPEEAARRRLLRLSKALSDDTRLRALRRLAETNRSLVELAEDLGVSKSTMHHHLAVLRSAGLLHWAGPHRDKRYALRTTPLSGMPELLGDYLGTATGRRRPQRRRG